MNFLAHFHLAWPEEGLIVGGLEGDFYKGPLKGDLPREIELGVMLHRAIDAYTDNHPHIVTLRRTMPRSLRRYAGILIDLSFDHFLARHWSIYSDTPQFTFNASVYRTLRAGQNHLSPGARRMLQRLIDHDILYLYRDWQTVTASAERVGQRFKRHNPFENIDAELTPLRDDLEHTFLAFYPELLTFCAEKIRELRQ